MREEVTPYRIDNPGGRNPQPETSAEMLAACRLMLQQFDHIESPQALEYAMLGIHHALRQYQSLKLKELIP